MNIKILKVSTNELVGASIEKGIAKNLPSIHDNWRFNFNKHALLPNSTAYVLVSEETSDVIEGCMIFQMRKKVEPYMAYLEVAPHNREIPKKYLYIAGCLIAFAYKQTFIQASGDYMGYLTFDVQESNIKNEQKLISLYNREYHAKIVAGTNSTMVISDEAGDSLIDEYLNRPHVHITNPKLN